MEYFSGVSGSCSGSWVSGGFVVSGGLVGSVVVGCVVGWVAVSVGSVVVPSGSGAVSGCSSFVSSSAFSGSFKAL